jgi:hypothetical protein
VSEQEQETVRVCGWCYHEVRERWVGDEGLTVCDECLCVEGPTLEVTLKQYEEMIA